MEPEIHSAAIKTEFRICPSCGYRDGFHNMFRKEGASIKWLFICPSCHWIFDIGMTLPQP